MKKYTGPIKFNFPLDYILGIIMMGFVVLMVNEQNQFSRAVLTLPIAIFYIASKIAYSIEHNKILDKIMEKKGKASD